MREEETTITQALDEDAGQEIMRLLVEEIKRRLREEAVSLKAADFEMIRKLLADNAVTFNSVRRGDFGTFAKTVSEEFPFPDGDGSETFN